MAHRITSSDGAIFFSQPAWHGIGTVLTSETSPTEAMSKAGLDWPAIKSTDIGVVLPCHGIATTSDYAGIIRGDTNEVLSIQSARYQIVQNEEVFRMAYALGAQVKVESAFSMDGGRRLVVLCRGNTITPSNSKQDEIYRYFALVNSHDGSYSFMLFPTSVRVVCHNTASQAIGEARVARRAYTVRHKGNMGQKMVAAEEALIMYRETGEMFQRKVNAMSERILTADEVQKFWVEVYGALYTPIVANPKTKEEQENNAEAALRLAGWAGTFDGERDRLGAPPSLWQAANAVTRDIQHGKRRGNSDPAARPFSNLVGGAQDETMLVFNKALALV